MSTSNPPTPTAGTGNLRRFNATMGLLHLGQGVLILLLASAFALPITTAFLKLDGSTGTLEPDLNELTTVRIAPLIAAFLFLSAIAHLAVSSPWLHGWYERNLARGINPARWIEYAVSSSVMIVVIAMLVGIYDIASLILIFALNATMILFGCMMELHNQSTDRTNWTSYWFGVFAGAVPWVAIFIYLVGSGIGPGGPPGFVYAIFVSIFLFFSVFALNMVMQYRKVGRWHDYLYGERVYVYLSLFAKSALAWQVFAGTLQPS